LKAFDHVIKARRERTETSGLRDGRREREADNGWSLDHGGRWLDRGEVGPSGATIVSSSAPGRPPGSDGPAGGIGTLCMISDPAHPVAAIGRRVHQAWSRSPQPVNFDRRGARVCRLRSAVVASVLPRDPMFRVPKPRQCTSRSRAPAR